MRWLFGTSFALLSASLSAHPGTGLVKDQVGNIYYTDLSNIWKIDPFGRKSIAVRGVHSHEMALDMSGRLVGDDVEYLGNERYRHRVWRLERDGTLGNALPWRDGFWRDYGVVHNGAGTFFWVTCPNRQCTIFQSRHHNRRKVLVKPWLIEGQVNWLAPGPDHSVYFVDGRSIRLASFTHLQTFAHNVGTQLMGMHSVNDGRTLYVASYGDKAVYRLDGHSKKQVARSQGTWGPTAVWLNSDGSFLLLEYSASNRARVRHLQNGRSKVL